MRKKLSSQTTKSVRRAEFLFSLFLALAVLLAASGCAPNASEGNGRQNGSASGDVPELTDEIIRERILYTRVRQVPPENGSGEPISWGFDEDEPKEITVVEKQFEGDRATIVLDIKTRSAPDAREPRYLAGQMRTFWELRTGWVLRQWEIVKTENISIKYKSLPKPPAQNPNP